MEILYGLAIIALTVVIIVKEVLSYKERIANTKINKARNVEEINYLFPDDTEQPNSIDEGNPDLVGMEEIIEVLEEE